jgi:hypothetical protein
MDGARICGRGSQTMPQRDASLNQFRDRNDGLLLSLPEEATTTTREREITKDVNWGSIDILLLVRSKKDRASYHETILDR